jgi:hypothetical protein
MKTAFVLSLFATVCVSPVLAAELKIATLSSRPEMVSGGDTLVKIELPDSVALNKVTVTRNGVNVSAKFKPGSGHFLVGLVDGLKLGENKLEAKAGVESASLTVTDYPTTGPIFSGTHESPFVCETAKAGLGEPIDTDCSIKTRVDFYYVTTAGKTVKLTNPKQYPADLATTTVLSGKTVPYVIRVESGTINRGIYQIALLDDPAKARTEAYEPNDGWNGRLQIAFGGGSGIGHHQGTIIGGFGNSGGPGGGGILAICSAEGCVLVIKKIPCPTQVRFRPKIDTSCGSSFWGQTTPLTFVRILQRNGQPAMCHGHANGVACNRCGVAQAVAPTEGVARNIETLNRFP